jgi:aspartyl-tRNA(Asn)/glutamyl-tRNA(Gln) amidotransferase subunit A
MARDAVSEDVAFLGAAEIARRIAARDLSPVEVTRRLLDRIERHDPRLHAFVVVHADTALEDARRAEAEIAAGRRRGPLHGVPIALKDIFDVAGQVTRAGSRILDGPAAVRHAHVVDRLLDAGALVIGRLNLHEFAFGLTTDNPHFGATHNPWRLERVPGGSSGGSGAALAAGLCALSLGTDTGGSIRIPAAACGIAGLKPTFGRVSRRGVVPLSWSLDHVGPMARRVADLALMLDVISTPDPEDEWCIAERATSLATLAVGDLAGVTVGVPRGPWLANLDPDVERAVDAALAALVRLGADRVDVDVPHIEHAYTATYTLIACEAAAFHRPWLGSRADDYGDDVRRGLEVGSFVPAVDYVDARRMQSLVRRGFGAALEKADVLVTPTLPRGAPPIGEPISREPHAAWNRLVSPLNLAGVPALSIPCGFDRDGLPVGLQIAGRWFDEATVLRVGGAFERATDWHRRVPPLD